MLTYLEPNIHPVLVHFAYALSFTSMICYWLSGLIAGRRDSLRAAADWMLAFGALAIIATIAAGIQAYYSIAHDGPSHAAMTTHRNWAIPTGTAILLLALWRWTARAKPVSLLFKALLTLAAISLSITAWWGGHIVYNYGLGVKSMPMITGDGHDHDHGDGGHAAADPVMATPPAHDNSDGHHDAPETKPHDNSDGHHDAPATAAATPAATPGASHSHDVPQGHDNSDGHHDAAPASPDDQAIKSIITAIQAGWEQGDGTPFRAHFLDFDGARYFESGGENTGLNDLVVNHVEPEKDAIPDLTLGLSNLQIHYEGDFAWAVSDSTVKGTIVSSGRVLDRTGKQTWLFRKVGQDWKVLHTHSSSREAKK